MFILLTPAAAACVVPQLATLDIDVSGDAFATLSTGRPGTRGPIPCIQADNDPNVQVEVGATAN